MSESEFHEESTDIREAEVEDEFNPNFEALGGLIGEEVYQLPPPLTPHYTTPPSASGADFLHFIKYLEQCRIQEDARRRQEEDFRRREDEQRRQEESARFTALLQRLLPVTSQPDSTHSLSGNTSSTSSVPTVSSSSSSVIPAPQKAITQNPPPLQADSSFQVFREWRCRSEDYSIMVDLSKLPREKQLIQLRMCLTLEMQRILEHTLDIPPNKDKTVEEVLDELQDHVKSLRNEALRRRELLSCKQFQGESFSEFYVLLKHIAEEVDVCPGNSSVCEETQMKMIILMGIRDGELVQKLISLDATASLQEVVNTCRSYEVARKATSAIRAPTSQLRVVSTYKKQKGGGKNHSSTPPPKPANPCQCCARNHHSSEVCPALESNCKNCGRRGHWDRTPKCPANAAQCRVCNRVGHYDKYCKTKRNDSSQGGSSSDKATPSSGKSKVVKKSSCRRVETTFGKSPKPVCVLLTYGDVTSRIQMLPDTGAEVSVGGPQHLDLLKIPRNSLKPFPTTVTLTADSSAMTPALGTFQATLMLGKQSCSAVIQVHDGVQTPLLSYSHCKELAIISSDFPKPILEVKHVKRCKGLPLSATTSPTEAREFLLREFKDVLITKEDLKTTPLQPMTGPPMRIHLKDGAVPFAVHTPRQIPFAFRDQVKEELASMVTQGIIKPAGNEPSEWCHPLVIVAKDSGVRITVDLTKLNSQVSRPTHLSPTPFAAIRSVNSKARYFTTADALCGYWQMALAEEDQHLTTFITPDKFVVAASQVSYCGYQLSEEGIAADPGKVSAIRDFPTLTNLTDLRSFMGLVNQLAKFTPEIAATPQPLRPLMSPKRAFFWTPDHDEAFRRDHSNGRLCLVQCGSRFLTDAESRYATIELELLAVVWAMSKCRLYLAGLQPFTLMTDHRPLIPILNHYTLDAVENPRFQCIKEKISPYLFTAVWQAGKQLSIPDALSRAPVSQPTPEDDITCADVATHVRFILNVNAVITEEDSTPQDADRTLQELRAAARADSSENLSTDGDLVLYGARIVVPAALRRRTLARLHDSHRGVEATKRRARQTVFWPGIDSDITSTVGACEPCQMLQPSLQQEPLLSDDHPTRPFESVSVDFFIVAGKSFLVVTDRLSGWPVMVPCKGDTTASNTIRIFCCYFREVGVPLRLRTDGGPQFASKDFQDFMMRWGVHHIMSSPHHPQSNGHAEASVKAIKHLILKTAPSGNIDCEEFDRGLLELRNTPNFTGHSPAQIFYGRPLRTCVPAHPQSFSEEWQAKSEDCDCRAAARAEQVKLQYDQHARPLPKLEIGQTDIEVKRKPHTSNMKWKLRENSHFHEVGVKNKPHTSIRSKNIKGTPHFYNDVEVKRKSHISIMKWKLREYPTLC
ncbi:uncharacterized protein [Palaemon carinicauda]|uniref:uncharacterized protein n=1 Tax=Palaemon carinicauda TaxID=392227 RepID=UPI0035B575D1